MGECMDCWRKRQGNGYTVSVDSVMPLIERLVEKVGSQSDVCRRMGVPVNTISAVKSYKRVRGSFVEKLKALEAEIAAEDKVRWQNQREPEVVAAEPLGQILRDFCRDWMIERPMGWGDDQMGGGFMGPVDFLFQKVNEFHEKVMGEPKMSIKLISSICNSHKEYVYLSQADALLTAIGKAEMLYTGEIKIIANPQWSLEAYMGYMKERGCI